MSHFLLTVLVAADTDNILYAVEQALESFEANTIFPELLKFFEGSLDDDELKRPPEDALTLEKYADAVGYDRSIQPVNHLFKPVQGKRWSDVFKYVFEYADYAMKHHCEPDPLTGKSGRWANPNGRWDHWSLGGDYSKSMDGNSKLMVSQIPADFLPFAILTPDGDWVEEGSLGMWGMVAGRMDEIAWRQAVQSIFSKYADHLAVSVDCHI